MKNLFRIIFLVSLLCISCIVQKETTEEKIAKAKAENKDYILHKVKKSESLYSIAKLYHIQVEDILAYNPSKKEIKKGQTINIPLKVSTKSPEDAVVKESEVSKKTSFNIGLLLPFNLNSVNFNHEEQLKLSPLTSGAVEFYEGALLAIDSLAGMELNLRLHIYDTRADSNEIKNILKKPELRKLNLIIDPLQNSNATLLANYALEHKINMVAPMFAPIDIVINNDYVSLPTPTVSTQCEKMSQYLVSKFKYENIFIVYNDKGKEAALASLFNKTISTSLSLPSIKELIYFKQGWKEIKESLSTTKKNIIIIPSSNEAFITDILSKLNFVKNNYNITVIGLPTWNNFETIDLELFDNLNVTIFNTLHIDYDNPQVKKFRLNYRNKYKTEPTTYAFLGFDIFLFYGNALFNHGNKLKNNLNKLNYKGLQSAYKFHKIGLNHGFENQNIFILEYQDYNLLKLN